MSINHPNVYMKMCMRNMNNLIKSGNRKGTTNGNADKPTVDVIYANVGNRPVSEEAIYGNRESQMPESTAIRISQLEAYIRNKKREEVPYKTEFEV